MTIITIITVEVVLPITTEGSTAIRRAIMPAAIPTTRAIIVIVAAAITISTTITTTKR